jgi:hypothetical protein
MSSSISNDRRRFGLFDVMILIAAIATAIGICRALQPSWRVDSKTPARMVYFYSIRYGTTYILPFLVSLTIAHVIIRLRRPRPLRERLMSYAGTVASVAAASVIALESVASSILWLIGTRSDFLPNPIAIGMAPNPGFAVIGGWIGLIASGRWSTEKTWIDRVGQVIGLLWVGVIVVTWASWRLM